RLLTAVEDAARDQGCVGAWLSAYAFQAPGFFEKNGYGPFGELASDVGLAGAADSRLCFFRKPPSRLEDFPPGRPLRLPLCQTDHPSVVRRRSLSRSTIVSSLR